MPDKSVSWARANLGVLITIACLAVGVISAYVGTATVAVNALSIGERAADDITKHKEDIQRHVDPVRDDAWKKDLIRRLERMESGIDRLNEYLRRTSP